VIWVVSFDTVAKIFALESVDPATAEKTLKAFQATVGMLADASADEDDRNLPSKKRLQRREVEKEKEEEKEQRKTRKRKSADDDEKQEAEVELKVPNGSVSQRLAKMQKQLDELPAQMCDMLSGVVQEHTRIALLTLEHFSNEKQSPIFQASWRNLLATLEARERVKIVERLTREIQAVVTNI
jgi:hypothetical protein